MKLSGIGEAHIPITTKSPEAQQWFDQGLALLHCFWDYEALRAFEEATRLDPDCAMCHWGLAQAVSFRGGAEDQSKAEIKKASELAKNATDLEQRYIRADAESLEKKGEEGDKPYRKEMEALIDRYPKDVDAKLLLALHVGAGYDSKGDPRPGAMYEQALLRDILHDYPDNAAANHYWIHAMEVSGHPEWAIESAVKLGKLAPASGHMVHMPGHIFYRVGDYERARVIFLSALRVDRDYMDSQHVAPINDWNYSHNLSYLIANCAEEGKYKEAREHARALQGLANDPDRTSNPYFYVLQIGSTEERLAIRFGDWDQAIEHRMNFGVPDDKLSVWARAYRDGLVEYARGMKAAETGDEAGADTHSKGLDALLWRLSQEKVEDKVKSQLNRVQTILATASLELRGNIETHGGNFESGRKLLEQADEDEKELGYSEPPQYSRPPMEVLGAACIRAGKYGEARDAYGKALAERPKSGFALYGIALAWDKQGDREQAAKAYREFLDAWSNADADLAQVKAARAYLASSTAERVSR